jgi:hypothetical protein
MLITSDLNGRYNLLSIAAMFIQLEIKRKTILLKTFSYNKQTNIYKIYTSLLIFLWLGKNY